jgi:hypothetical protein
VKRSFFPFRLSIERKPGGFPKTGSGQTTKVEVKFGIVLSDPSIQVLQISNQDQVQVRVEIHPDQVKNGKKGKSPQRAFLFGIRENGSS